MAQCIFLIEDHKWVRDVLARLLELQPGLEICGKAESAEEALAMLPAGADLVIVDMAMGGMSGLELVAAVRERWPGLPCIVLSGKPAVEYAAAARDAGAFAYVEKGDAPALLAAIEAAGQSVG